MENLMLKKALIISDNRAGHENQSIAFCKLLDIKYDILHVKYQNRFIKTISYLLDFAKIYTDIIFTCENKKISKNNYQYIITCGSTTYYAGKYFAKKIDSKLVALMYPKGFRNDFYRIFAPLHDSPKNRTNTIILPANISYVEAQNVYISKNKKAIGVVIGGNNSIFTINKKELKKVLESIKNRFKNYEIAVTTSPRTPFEIEKLIEDFNFDYSVIYSKNRVNPIADFLFTCEYVFLTEDSTSMISDAISNGSAKIEIIKLESKSIDNKFKRFIDSLTQLELVHIYDGSLSDKSKKINLQYLLKEAMQ